MFRKTVLAAVIALSIGTGVWGIHAWRYRFIREDADLFRYLPNNPGSTFFADINAIRQVGFVSLLAGTRNVLRDPDYEQFVRDTGFDYTRDLDTLVAKTGTVPVLIARGRFNWGKLHRFAESQKQAGNKRQLTFTEIQPDVLLLKTGTVPVFTHQLAQSSVEKTGTVPVSDPIWLRLGPEVLLHPEELPASVRIFAVSLSQAQNVMLSLGPATAVSGSAFILTLRATLPNPAAARTAQSQLELQTRMLSVELAREHQQPDPASLTGLLTAGTFESAGKAIRGTWPIRNELLQALQ